MANLFKLGDKLRSKRTRPHNHTWLLGRNHSQQPHITIPLRASHPPFHGSQPRNGCNRVTKSHARSCIRPGCNDGEATGCYTGILQAEGVKRLLHHGGWAKESCWASTYSTYVLNDRLPTWVVGGSEKAINNGDCLRCLDSRRHVFGEAVTCLHLLRVALSLIQCLCNIPFN